MNKGSAKEPLRAAGDKKCCEIDRIPVSAEQGVASRASRASLAGQAGRCQQSKQGVANRASRALPAGRRQPGFVSRALPTGQQGVTSRLARASPAKQGEHLK